MARPQFYPNGLFIDYRFPDHYRKSVKKEACGNCGMYSQFRGFCGVYKARGIDNYVCNNWRTRYFKR